MSRTYSNCFYCGGEVEEQYMPRELRWQDKWYILEDVPVDVCQQCGEKFLKPEVAKTIDRILQGGKAPLRTLEVPVYAYESDPVCFHDAGTSAAGQRVICEAYRIFLAGVRGHGKAPGEYRNSMSTTELPSLGSC